MILDLAAALADVPLHDEMQLTLDGNDTGVVLCAHLGRSWQRGPDDVLNGGVLAMLLDIALTYALVVPSARDWMTVDLRVDFVRGVKPGSIRIEASAIHAGRRVGRSQARLTDYEGRLCVLAVGTFAAGGSYEQSGGSGS